MFGEVPPAELYNVDIASFYPTERDIQKLVLGIDPMQDLHGYDNPWPAGGGKNKLPPRTIAELQALNTSGTWSGNTYTHNGVSFACSVEDGYVNTLTLSGTATAFARFDFYRREDFAQFSGMIMNWYTQYISGVSITIQGSDSPWTTYVASPGTDRTIDTIDNSTCNLFVSVQANTVISSPLPMKPMIRLSSVADSTFAPYSNLCPISGFTGLNVYVSPTQDVQDATVYPISWQNEAGTVYGGTLDVTKGVLTVTHNGVDGGSLTWVKEVTNYRTFTALANDAFYNISLATIISSSYKSTSNSASSASDDNYVWIRSSGVGTEIAVKDTSKSGLTEAQFQTALSGVQFVYELATPLTYQLTPQQIATLHPGINNVWCDTGPVIELIS